MLKRVPEEIDYEQTAKIMSDDPSPLNVVLLQEVSDISYISNLIDLTELRERFLHISSQASQAQYVNVVTNVTQRTLNRLFMGYSI